jgi:hypothetical protein
MRILEIIFERIDPNKINNYMTQLQQLGYTPTRGPGASEIVIKVPSKDRIIVSKFIMDKIPDSQRINNDKIVKTADGIKILVKPEGGRGGGGRNYETSQIKKINEFIKSTCEKTGVPAIKLQVGKSVVLASEVKKLPEGLKADIAILNSNGEEIAWISLKQGPGPDNIPGWGGVNHLGRDIEIRAFADKAKALFPQEFPRRKCFISKVTNKRLKDLVVFGKNFGGAFGRSNVNLVLQGEPLFNQTENGTYIITGDANTWANGQTPTGDYDPVLCVRRGDRSDFGVPLGRIFMNPLRGRPAVDIDSVPIPDQEKSKPVVTPSIPPKNITPQNNPPQDLNPEV